MNISAFFRAIEKISDGLANQPSQGKAMLFSYLLQPLKLLNREGCRRSRGFHFFIYLHHFAAFYVNNGIQAKGFGTCINYPQWLAFFPLRTKVGKQVRYFSD